MLKKTCPKCGKKSYGLSEFALWICHHCEASLRYVESEPADIEDGGIKCIWCETKMTKLPDGQYICSSCGWRYKKERGARSGDAD